MKEYCFGIDVGGTTVKLGLFNQSGDILDKWEIPTRTEDHGKNILPDVAEALEKKLQEKNISKDDVIGAGIGVPGPVDDNGVVHRAVNLGWDVFNISEVLGSLTGLSVKAGNDANVAALGELWKGGGQGYKSIVMVTLGTGVGGGVIVNGKILSGCSGAGGEIGHIHIVDDEEDSCGCGNHGCLEQYASATGIVRLAHRRLQSVTEPTALKDSEVSAKTVFDAVKAGDTVAIQIAEEFGLYLGKGLAAVASVVNPEAFVIGGGVSKAGTIITDVVKRYYGEFVYGRQKTVEIVIAKLGNDAGIYGCAKLVLS